MSLGLIGKKCGMTRFFTDSGASVPVTVILVMPNRVTQVKTKEVDGYRAAQVTTGERKAARINKPLSGHYAKFGTGAGDGLWEFRLETTEEVTEGQVFDVGLFTEGQLVDVSGFTKGKGFAGVMKRHHFAGGAASHGNSLSHRVPGSIGQRQTPGRVFKGKKMAGHLGNVRRTIQSQRVLKIDSGRGLIMVEGGVPGAPGSYVVVRCAVKCSGDGRED